jgi:RNA polymerase sigma factor (sigma-70 family)
VLTLFKKGYTDQEIIKAIVEEEGSEDRVLSYLYKESLPEIKKYIMNNSGSMEDAKDIFQEAVIRCYNAIKLGKFKGNSTLKTFLFGISKNLWMNSQRNKNRKAMELDHVVLADTIDLEENLISKEKTEAVNSLLKMIGERCEKLLRYSVYENMPMKEIAEKMQFPNENVAKTNNYRCKQKLMQLIAENKMLLQLFDK